MIKMYIGPHMKYPLISLIRF